MQHEQPEITVWMPILNDVYLCAFGKATWLAMRTTGFCHGRFDFELI